MDKIFGFIFEIILGVLILFAAVVTYFELRTETVTKTLGANTTEKLVEDVKYNGYMTTGDYEKFMKKLSFTNTLYDISFEHQYNVFEPKYRLRTLQEIRDAQNAAYKGSNIYNYREIKTTAPSVYDPVNSGSLNTETNESVLASSVSTPADPSHVHTPECYVGHHHNDKPGNFTWHHTHESGKCVEYVSARYTLVRCNSCGKEHSIASAFWHWDNGTVFDDAFNSPLQCPFCGSNSVSSSYTKYDYGYSCGFISDFDGDGYNDQIPYNVDKVYNRSIPEMSDSQNTYTDGCWTYHRHNDVGGFDVNTNGGKIRNLTPIYALQNNTLFHYCYIPKYYTFTITVKWKHSLGYYIYSPMSASYQAEKDENGNLVFSYIRRVTINGTEYSNKVYITKEELRSIFTSDYDGLYKALSDMYSPCSPAAPEINTIKFSCSDQSFQSCNLENGWTLNCGKPQDETLDCDKIITSLSPTHPKQTVAINDPLITTVRATYKDGSTKVVVATADFSTAAVCQNKEVMLTYHYSIDGMTFAKSCTITVNVVPRTRICPNGHTYHLLANGSDPGCPYCKAWIKSLRFLYPTTTDMTITIGTSLQDNGVKLLATYMDGRTEVVTSGYEDNLDMNYLGSMVVTVGYKGAGLQVRVTTVCKKVLCTICGNYYSLYPDGTDPGCPYCLMKIPVFTGEAMKYDEKTYTEQILDSLYQKGIYYFDKGDIFTVSVKNKSSGMGRKLLQKFIPSLSDRWFDLKRKVRVYSG